MRAAVFGAAMGIAMGVLIAGRALEFPYEVSADERRQWAENWIKATAQETAIIARCTGKTNVHNLEPEDMRSITLTGAAAMDIPLASGRGPRGVFLLASVLYGRGLNEGWAHPLSCPPES